MALIRFGTLLEEFILKQYSEPAEKEDHGEPTRPQTPAEFKARAIELEWHTTAPPRPRPRKQPPN